jgi:predicted 3-demethylubiquinone-9 3-methyltransferase (glyoxalase superfamily)
MPSITPCLWFFYTSLFENSRIVDVARYGEAGPGPAGQVMNVVFELDGRRFTALNGGPLFQFNEAVSFQVECRDQEEVDRLWNSLTDGGEESQCGWLKDRYGVSWQIVPAVLGRLLGSPETDKAQRAMQAMLQMRKIEIDVLQKAYDGA